jgi:hypothetical protein
MKSICILLFGLICLLLASCNSDKNEKKESLIYIFIDITDTFRMKNMELFETTLNNDRRKLFDIMGISTSTGGLSGGVIKYFLLDDISTSPYSEVTLKAAPGGIMNESGNIYIRRDDIKKFDSLNAVVVNDILKDRNWFKPKSKIYQQICRQLNLMKESKADQKVVVIYSNMLENSSLISFYKNNETINRLIDNFPESIVKAKQDCEFPDLSEIKIYIVAQRTAELDDKINLAEKFWGKLFKSYNAKEYVFASDLTIY